MMIFLVIFLESSEATSGERILDGIKKPFQNIIEVDYDDVLTINRNNDLLIVRGISQVGMPPNYHNVTKRVKKLKNDLDFIPVVFDTILVPIFNAKCRETKAGELLLSEFDHAWYVESVTEEILRVEFNNLIDSCRISWKQDSEGKMTDVKVMEWRS